MDHNKQFMPQERGIENYRPCVGMVVFNKEGLVFSGKRLFQSARSAEKPTHLWQFPQGGIEEGETPLEAAKRELYEETGMRSLELLEELPEWLFYTFPDSIKKQCFGQNYAGQKQKWFAFTFVGEDSEIAVNPPPSGYNQEFECWQWRFLQEMPALVVPFKRGVYEQVAESFSHLSLKFQKKALYNLERTETDRKKQ